MTAPDAPEQNSRTERLSRGLADHLLAAGIDGHGKLPSATQAAAREATRGGDRDEIVGRLVSKHTAMAGAEGFVTGLGGFVTLPIAIPANIIGFYVIATRMTASIAAASGYDLNDHAVRSAVLVCLSGEDATDILRNVGLGGGGSRVTHQVLAGLPPSMLMVINKGVAFRLVTGLGKRSLSWLGRGVPLAGGVIGAGLDAILIRRIARIAREQFPPMTGVTVTAPGH